MILVQKQAIVIISFSNFLQRLITLARKVRTKDEVKAE